MAELCSAVKWKVELARDELGYLGEEMSKQNMEGAAWFLLPANRKMQEESDKWKKELLSKKNDPALKDLENSQHI